jgi:hypothetical protein
MDGWDYEHYLEQLDYKSQKNEFFELWQYKVAIVRHVLQV